MYAALACALVAGGCATHGPHVPDPITVRIAAITRAHLEDSTSWIPRDRHNRSQRLMELLKDAGCQGANLRKSEAGSRHTNVICTLPGQTSATIVVGAHTDRAADGHGVFDNWTGVAMLPVLYRALALEPRHHTFVFAGFADGRISLRGSRTWWGRLSSEERDDIRAMVGLKALGLSTTATWSTRADDALHQDLYSVSRAMDLPLRHVRFFQNVTIDAKTFRRRGVPTITIHSYDAQSALHLDEPIRDRHFDKIDFEAYHETARLVAAYLAYLDETMRIRFELRELREAGPQADLPAT